MASSTNLEVLKGGDDDPVDKGHRLDLAIEVLRARVNQELKISERLDAKARQAFGLVAAFFAVAQAVTFGSFRAGTLSGIELIGLGILAGVAAVSVGLTGHRLADAEEGQGEQDIEPKDVEQWARDMDDRGFAERRVVELRDDAEKRRAGNVKRRTRYERLEVVARWALILTTAELLFGIAFRA